jgi:hypothetical protein
LRSREEELSVAPGGGTTQCRVLSGVPDRLLTEHLVVLTREEWLSLGGRLLAWVLETLLDRLAELLSLWQLLDRLAELLLLWQLLDRLADQLRNRREFRLLYGLWRDSRRLHACGRLGADRLHRNLLCGLLRHLPWLEYPGVLLGLQRNGLLSNRLLLDRLLLDRLPTCRLLLNWLLLDRLPNCRLLDWLLLDRLLLDRLLLDWLLLDWLLLDRLLTRRLSELCL